MITICVLLRNHYVIVIINSYYRFSNDPQISSIAEELVENVAKLPSASSILCGKLVPFLVQSLNQSEEVLNDPSDTSINNTFLATCLDITTRLVRSIQKPVSQEFINGKSICSIIF